MVPIAVMPQRCRALEGVVKTNLAELLWKRLRFGVHVAFSPRMTSTPYEVKNVPRFSAVDPNYVPARTAFLVRTARTVLLSYFPPDLVDLVGGQPKKNAARFSPQAVPSHAADHVPSTSLDLAFPCFTAFLSLLVSHDDP